MVPSSRTEEVSPSPEDFLYFRSFMLTSLYPKGESPRRSKAEKHVHGGILCCGPGETFPPLETRIDQRATAKIVLLIVLVFPRFLLVRFETVIQPKDILSRPEESSYSVSPFKGIRKRHNSVYTEEQQDVQDVQHHSPLASLLHSILNHFLRTSDLSNWNTFIKRCFCSAGMNKPKR